MDRAWRHYLNWPSKLSGPIQYLRSQSAMNGFNPNTSGPSFKKQPPHNNRKSTATVSSGPSVLKADDKFGQLRSKLQKEKEMMRKTGKRFREDTCTSTVSTQELSVEAAGETSPTDNKQQTSKHEISIGPDQPVKQTISLGEICNDSQVSTEDLMKSSRVFENEKTNQKKRSKEMIQFLTKIQLQNFADALINNGYDDLETLQHITTQDLNMIMMRAGQQVKLLEALKKQSFSKEQIHNVSTASQMSNTSTLWRLKTEPMPQPKNESLSMKIIAQMKDTKNAQPVGPKPGSFLYSVGSKNWSVQDQVRRACSVCYKVEQQMQQKGECFYCSGCYKSVSGNLLQMELGLSMNRAYRKQD